MDQLEGWLGASGLEQVEPGVVVLLVAAGLAAGFIDAVVGGGGLLQLPVVLMVPGISPVQALATNKMGSVFGTATSALTFYRRTSPDLRTALPMAGVALAGSFGGAALAASLPEEVFRPVILAALAVFQAALVVGEHAGVEVEVEVLPGEVLPGQKPANPALEGVSNQRRGRGRREGRN